MCTRPDDYCECVDCKKNKEPTFQVGKKYKDIGNSLVFECMYASDNHIVIRRDGIDYGVSKPSWCYYKEYKEPRTITRWVCVFENSVRLMFSSSYLFNSKEEACKWAVTTSYKLIEIVEFKYTEKVP